LINQPIFLFIEMKVNFYLEIWDFYKNDMYFYLKKKLNIQYTMIK